MGCCFSSSIKRNAKLDEGASLVRAVDAEAEGSTSLAPFKPSEYRESCKVNQKPARDDASEVMSVAASTVAPRVGKSQPLPPLEGTSMEEVALDVPIRNGTAKVEKKPVRVALPKVVQSEREKLIGQHPREAELAPVAIESEEARLRREAEDHAMEEAAAQVDEAVRAAEETVKAQEAKRREAEAAAGKEAEERAQLELKLLARRQEEEARRK
eukprot:4092655-Pleurochrysis_carterae.AAC.7